MALTKADLMSIRGVMDEAIAEHPRFVQLRVEISEDICEVMQEGFTQIDQRFDMVEQRLDNLRIVSNS